MHRYLWHARPPSQGATLARYSGCRDEERPLGERCHVCRKGTPPLNRSLTHPRGVIRNACPEHPPPPLLYEGTPELWRKVREGDRGPLHHEHRRRERQLEGECYRRTGRAFKAPRDWATRQLLRCPKARIGREMGETQRPHPRMVRQRTLVSRTAFLGLYESRRLCAGRSGDRVNGAQKRHRRGKRRAGERHDWEQRDGRGTNSTRDRSTGSPTMLATRGGVRNTEARLDRGGDQSVIGELR